MKTQRVSLHWDLHMNHYMTELVPNGSQKEHYAGDECWCYPNRLTLRHEKKRNVALRVWVHDSDVEDCTENIVEAIDGLLEYWDGHFSL